MHSSICTESTGKFEGTFPFKINPILSLKAGIIKQSEFDLGTDESLTFAYITIKKKSKIIISQILSNYSQRHLLPIDHLRPLFKKYAF